MKLVPMRFDYFTWHHNPKSIKISSKKEIVKLKSPYNTDTLQNFGEELKVVSGTGELYGSDCLEQFAKLNSLYKKGTPSKLSIPKTITMYAYFSSLQMLGEPKGDVLSYSFEFLETFEKTTHFDQMYYHEVEDAQDLWDIAYMYDKSIDDLVRLNPQIQFINDLTDGERVRIC